MPKIATPHADAAEPELARLRAVIARASHRGDAGAADAARQEYRELKLAAHIRDVVDQAPPLTAEQRDRLALLLRGAS